MLTAWRPRPKPTAQALPLHPALSRDGGGPAQTAHRRREAPGKCPTRTRRSGEDDVRHPRPECHRAVNPGGVGYPQLPSASCRSTIQSTRRRRARLRPGRHGKASYSLSSLSAHQKKPDPGTRVSKCSVPGITSSGTLQPGNFTGRREITINSGAMVPRLSLTCHQPDEE